MTERTLKAAVVGGGISGLSAAYYLQKQAKEQGISLDLTIIEAVHRLGGKIQTLHRDGFVIERGPDSFLSGTENIDALAKDLGIEHRLIASGAGKSFVMVEDQMHPIPKGSVMGVPTKWGPFIASNLSSWSGKFRAAADLVMPKSAESADQPLGRFMRRRFGKELVENLIEPIFSGLYDGDIDRMSLASTFPAFYQIEQKHRSLITGMKKEGSMNVDSFTTASEGIFQTFENGMQTIVDALESALSDCTILKGVKVEKIGEEQGKAILHLNNDSDLLVDEAVFALPHEKVQPLFEPFGLLEDLKEMPSTSVATVSMAFSREAVDPSIGDGMGFVVSRNSDFTITKCLAMHTKWPAHVPTGKMLFKAFVGRTGDEAVVDLSDREIEKTVLQDLRKAIPISGDPDFTIVTRWKDAMPQYQVGHEARINTAKKDLKKAFPMVQLIGSSFEGGGLPACVQQAQAAAAEIINRYRSEK